MKARVKATGEFIEVVPSIYDKGSYDGSDGYTYTKESLIMLEDEPDYWEKLKHQAVITAMQGLLSNDNLLNFLCNQRAGISISDTVADNAIIMATELVNKLKEEEKCEK